MGIFNFFRKPKKPNKPKKDVTLTDILDFVQTEIEKGKAKGNYNQSIVDMSIKVGREFNLSDRDFIQNEYDYEILLFMYESGVLYNLQKPNSD